MTTKTPTLATAEILTEAQASTNMPSSAIYTQQLDARQGVITPGQKPSKLPGESQERPAKCNEPYKQNLATVTPQPVCWLWSHRLPLAGITILDGDHYLRQAGATVALARAARYTGDERYLARARQAVLTLLADTAVDANKPGARAPLLPPVVANPLAAAGLVVQAVHELPEPAADLLEQSDQLCAFLRDQQQADGALR